MMEVCCHSSQLPLWPLSGIPYRNSLASLAGRIIDPSPTSPSGQQTCSDRVVCIAASCDRCPSVSPRALPDWVEPGRPPSPFPSSKNVKRGVNIKLIFMGSFV